MDSQEIIRIVFLNEKAALWAITYGPLLALLYLYFLEPFLPRCRSGCGDHHANLKKFIAIVGRKVRANRRDRPARPSTPPRSRGTSLDSALFQTPHSPPPDTRRSVSYKELESPSEGEEEEVPRRSLLSPSSCVEDSQFTVVGTAMKLTPGVPVTTTTASPGKKSWFKHRRPSEENTFLTTAIEEGHIVFTPGLQDQSKVVMTYNRIFQGVLERYKARQLYLRQAKEGTRKALDGLFATEAFQDWFLEHEEEIHREVEVRQRGMLFRRLATCFMLLLICYTLPFFSFQGGSAVRRSPLTALLDPVAYQASAPTNWQQLTFIDLLSRTLSHLQTRAGTYYTSLSASTTRVELLQTVGSLLCYHSREWLVMTAFFALLVSAFMPRRETYTASTALFSLLYLLAEIWLTDEKKELHLQCGCGFTALMVMTMIAVVKPMRRRRHSKY